jgi:hypothetical protein
MRLRPVGRRIREKPESAAAKPGRESEVAEVPEKLAISEWREGPLLSSSEQSRERLPDCPRKGRLNPGPVKPGAKRPRDSIMPASCNGRYTEWPSNSPEGGSRFSTIRSVEGTSCKRPGKG